MTVKKAWSKPELQFLDVHMTEAATYDQPDHDEAWNGDNTATYPDGKLYPHHES